MNNFNNHQDAAACVTCHLYLTSQRPRFSLRPTWAIMGLRFQPHILVVVFSGCYNHYVWACQLHPRTSLERSCIEATGQKTEKGVGSAQLQVPRRPGMRANPWRHSLGSSPERDPLKGVCSSTASVCRLNFSDSATVGSTDLSELELAT